jgi:hypothetical protein
MAPAFFSRRRPQEQEPVPAAVGGPPEPTRPVRRRLPPASQLRRERRALIRAREQRIRDLGGLMLEMYRRDEFRQDLLVDRCGELLLLEERLAELDALLAVAASARARRAARCECGSPILWGSRFCAHCGRPIGEAAVPADAGAPGSA